MFSFCTCCVLGSVSSKPYIYCCGDFESRISSDISNDSGGELSNCGGGAGQNSGGGEILTGELSTCRGLKHYNYNKLLQLNTRKINEDMKKKKINQMVRIHNETGISIVKVKHCH